MVTTSRARPLFAAALAFATALSQTQMQYSAKLVLEDGSPLTTSPQVFAECQVQVFGNGTIVFIPNYIPFTEHRRDPDVCDVRVVLEGFRSVRVTLRDKAVIVMKRLGEHEGSTVSVTSLNAPPPARKAYDRGTGAMRQQKWAQAQKSFEEAVARFDRYAAAWSELGTALEQQGRMDEARSAYDHASRADPKYIKPLVQLAGLEAKLKRWAEAAEAGERALALHPVEFPGAYFYYALAAYQLRRLKDAEEAARQSIDVDPSHEFPKAYLVLGSVLVERGDTRAALQAFDMYLKLAPRAADVPAVKARIAELERRL